MHVLSRFWRTTEASRLGLLALGLLAVAITSCNSAYGPPRQVEANLDPGWPKGNELWSETSTVSRMVRSEDREFLQPVPQVPVPVIPNAQLVGVNEFCGTCHETYTRAFANNVHREHACEKCHGGASLHLETRGTAPDTILSFRPPEVGTSAGRLISPQERAAICLQCHENAEAGQNAPHLTGGPWGNSAHARNGITCANCHRNHYNVPLGTPAVDNTAMMDPGRTYPVAGSPSNEVVRFQGPQVAAPPGGVSMKLGAVSPDICYPCHADKIRMEQIVHPHQIGIPLDFQCTMCHDPAPRGYPHQVEGHPTEFNCTTCHDVHGNILPETRKDLCLKCHDGAHMDEWHSSPHKAANLACTDCHNPHSTTGPPMHVDQPETCYRCHDDKRELEQIAHPHQIGGPNEFICTTCHNPHAKVQPATRKDLCLECHDGAPTMAWHSSSHNREGVACTDCHNPHPKTDVPRVVAVSHTTLKRPRRLPMSVDEPEACYKCHPKIYGFSMLPSHHPIAEGKMVCSDCHDAHGQAQGNLKEATINEVCYECHAEKEGPFAYEHAPVTENCAICHEPHGTVANNLLRQPTTFLCMRCHSGHSTHGASENCFRCHFVGADITNVAGGPMDAMAATTPMSREALFTDCTQCHSQVHGSDLPSGMACFDRKFR